MQVNLLLLKKDGTIRPFSLPSTVTLIGRRQECDLCIPLTVVSRKHCEICVEQNKLMIRDLHSKNGTFVNGNKIEDAQLHPGDQITFGPVTFVVQVDGIPAQQDVAPMIPPQHVHPPAEVQAAARESKDHFDEFAEDVKELHPSSSHTATEIPDIINDDLAAQA